MQDFAHLGVKVTEQDAVVLRLLVAGANAREIAGHIGLKPRSVKQHLSALYKRTRTPNRIVLALAAANLQPPENFSDSRLTARENEIAKWAVQGLLTKEISRQAGISEQMVKNYLRSVFNILGVWSRLELALMIAVPISNEGTKQ